MKTALPPGYRTRPATWDDLASVAALIALAQEVDSIPSDMTAEELAKDWRACNLAEESIVVFDGKDNAVGYADLLNRNFVQISVYVYVPDHPYRRQIWAYLIAWGEAWMETRLDRASAGVRVTVQHFLSAENQAGRGLLAAMGYSDIRTHFRMEAELAEAPPPPSWPDDILCRTYRPGVDDDALFAAGEEAFRDLWNRPDSTRERWLAPSKEPGFDSTLWFLAEESSSGTVVALCLCSPVGERGEVDVVAVRRPWRRRGLGLALLQQALGTFWQRQIRCVHLSVDAESSTGAPQLYRIAGFTVHSAYARFEKVIREATENGGR